jgi:hypothetical protein
MGGVDRDDQRAIRSPLEIVIPITQAMVDDRSTENAPDGQDDALSASNTLQCPDKARLSRKPAFGIVT